MIGSMSYADPTDQRRLAGKRDHYRRNKHLYDAAKKAKREKLVALLRKHKDVPCADCGIKYPFYVMQFDHVRGEKKYTPATLVTRGSVKLLEDELAKCEVVCANCHAERTWQRTAKAPPLE